MRAAQISEYGGQQVVHINPDADQPSPAVGQVLVAVHAAAVNPFDIKVREGSVRQMGEPSFPATLGGDFAGVVAAVGEDVSDFQVGDSVYGQAGALSGHGSFAECTTAKAGSVGVKPASIDFVQAAALPLTAVSAYQALVDHADLQAGQKILIHGGAGGIGSLAIQIAKQLGARVVVTVRGADDGFVRQLGADEVIDFETQDFTESAGDCDVVFDTVGGETNVRSYQVLKPGGVFVSMAAPADEALVAERQLRYIAQSTRVTTDRLDKVAALVDKGGLRANVDKVFPLDDAAAALEYLKTGRPRGKVVIRVTD